MQARAASSSSPTSPAPDHPGRLICFKREADLPAYTITRVGRTPADPHPPLICAFHTQICACQTHHTPVPRHPPRPRGPYPRPPCPLPGCLKNEQTAPKNPLPAPLSARSRPRPARPLYGGKKCRCKQRTMRRRCWPCGPSVATWHPRELMRHRHAHRAFLVLFVSVLGSDLGNG